jgi:hypothetical protein
VPVVETTGIGRTGILVHSAVGAAGTIGCILVAKTSGSTGTFTGGRASSLAALAEIQAALTINSGGVAKWLFSYGYLTVENDM